MGTLIFDRGYFIKVLYNSIPLRFQLWTSFIILVPE